MKSRINIGILSVLFSVFFMTSCENYPGYDDYVDEQLVTVSSYNAKTNFTQYKTFSIADTVALVDNGTVTKVAITDPKYPALQKYAEKVKSNLTEAGFTYALLNPDLGVNLSLVKTTNTYVSYPWWWWEYCYWDYWGCGYYPFYPYPYPVVVGGYSVGVLAMDMFDLKNITDNKVPAIWTGIVRGLYTGTHTDQEISAAIDQCFDQSAPFNNKK